MDSGRGIPGHSTENVSGRGSQNVSRPASTTNTKRHVQEAICKEGNISMEGSPSGSSTCRRETAGGAHISKYSIPAALPPSVKLTSRSGKNVSNLGCKTCYNVHSPTSADRPHAQDSLVNVAAESLNALVSDTGSRIFRRSRTEDTSRGGEDADDEESSYFLVGRRHKVIRSKNAALFKDNEKDSSEEEDAARSSKMKVRRRASRTYKSSTTNFLSNIISSDITQSSVSPNTSLLTLTHEQNARNKTREAAAMASSSLHPVVMDSDDGASFKRHRLPGTAFPDPDIRSSVSLHEVVSALQGLDDDTVVPQQLNRTRNAKCELRFTKLHEVIGKPFTEGFPIESNMHNSDTVNTFRRNARSLSHVKLDRYKDSYSCRKKLFSLNEQVQTHTVDSGNCVPFEVALDNKSNNGNGDEMEGPSKNRKMWLADDAKHARASTGTEATQDTVLHDTLLYCCTKRQARRFKPDASNRRVSNLCPVGHFTLKDKTTYPKTKTEYFENKVLTPSSKLKKKAAAQSGVSYVKGDNIQLQLESDYSSSKASVKFEQPEISQELCFALEYATRVKYSAALASKHNCTDFKPRQAILKDAMLARIMRSCGSTIKRRRSVIDKSRRNSTDQNNKDIPDRICSPSTNRLGCSQNTYIANGNETYSKDMTYHRQIASHQKIQHMQRTLSGIYGSMPKLKENHQEQNVSYLHDYLTDQRGRKHLGQKTLNEPEFLKDYLYCHKMPPTPRFVPLRCPMLCIKAVKGPEVSSHLEKENTKGCLNSDKAQSLCGKYHAQSQSCQTLVQRKVLHYPPLRRGMKLYTVGTLASDITHNQASSLWPSSNNKYFQLQMKQPSLLKKYAAESRAKRLCNQVADAQEDTNSNGKASVSESSTVAGELPRVITCQIAGMGSVTVLSASQVAVDLHEVFDWNFTPVSDTLAEDVVTARMPATAATPPVSLLQKQNAGKLKSLSKSKDLQVNLARNQQSNGLQVTRGCLSAEPEMPHLLPYQSSSNRSTNKGQQGAHVPSAADNKNPSVAGNSKCESHESKAYGWLGLLCVAERNTAQQPITDDIVNRVTVPCVAATLDEGVSEKQNRFKTEDKTGCSLHIPVEEKWIVGKFHTYRKSGDENNTEITVDVKYRTSCTETIKGFGDKQIDQLPSFNMPPETIAGGDNNVVKDKNDKKKCPHKHLPPLRFCSSPSAVPHVANGDYIQGMDITLQVDTEKDLIVTSKELISAITTQKRDVANTIIEKRHEVLKENDITKTDKTQRRTQENATTKKEKGVGGHASSTTDSWKKHMINEGVVWYSPVTSTELQPFKNIPLSLEDCIAGLKEKTIQPHGEYNQAVHGKNKALAMEESAENERSRNNHTDQSKNSVLRLIFSLTPVNVAGGHTSDSVADNVSKKNSVNKLNGDDGKDNVPTNSKPSVQVDFDSVGSRPQHQQWHTNVGHLVSETDQQGDEKISTSWEKL